MSTIAVTAADRAMLLDAADILDTYASEIWRSNVVPVTKQIADRETAAEHRSVVRAATRLRALAARARKASTTHKRKESA